MRKWKQLDRTTNNSAVVAFSATPLWVTEFHFHNDSGDTEISIGPSNAANWRKLTPGDVYPFRTADGAPFNLADWYFKGESGNGKQVRIIYV